MEEAAAQLMTMAARIYNRRSPALKAGLRPGDVIIAVDADTVTAATDISAVSRRLRGQAGSGRRGNGGGCGAAYDDGGEDI